ncbi:hypothetical protein Bbelb_360680 [Branchiostoma belcheri]|nr:hypothetical protein Bbelb_360680 [Branchiostoma belcheri]
MWVCRGLSCDRCHGNSIYHWEFPLPHVEDISSNARHGVQTPVRRALFMGKARRVLWYGYIEENKEPFEHQSTSSCLIVQESSKRDQSRVWDRVNPQRSSGYLSPLHWGK